MRLIPSPRSHGNQRPSNGLTRNVQYLKISPHQMSTNRGGAETERKKNRTDDDRVLQRDSCVQPTGGYALTARRDGRTSHGHEQKPVQHSVYRTTGTQY